MATFYRWKWCHCLCIRYSYCHFSLFLPTTTKKLSYYLDNEIRCHNSNSKGQFFLQPLVCIIKLMMFLGPAFSFTSTRCWKHSRDFSPCWRDCITVAAESSRAHQGRTSPVPRHPKGALLDWHLATVAAISVQWSHCHVRETTFRWSDLCEIVCYPIERSNEKMCTLWS